jgi:hypothetical protein
MAATVGRDLRKPHPPSLSPRALARYWILTLVLAVGGGEGLNVLLKHAYERARPVFDNPLVELMSYSFPSGPHRRSRGVLRCARCFSRLALL